ncbi:MAG: hypothetical protein OEM01_02355 [Desulfobulbaceae bacterium]|nr:hypothetical protein [Desulfobulbaceae bacterium]
MAGSNSSCESYVLCRTIRLINRRIRTLYRIKQDRRLNASAAFRGDWGGNASRLADARTAGNNSSRPADALGGGTNDRGYTGILADNDIENPCEGRTGTATSRRYHGDTCRKDLRGTCQNDHRDTRSIDHKDSRNDC